MAGSFATCDACARHVRAQDTHCPFCQTVITAVAPVRAPRLHRSRAAILAGAALAIGCSSSDTTGSDGGSGNGDDGGSGGDASMAQPVYGAPVGDSGIITRPGSDSGTGDASVGEPAYGAPVHADGGIDDGDGGSIQPVYGSPVGPP